MKSKILYVITGLLLCLILCFNFNVNVTHAKKRVKLNKKVVHLMETKTIKLKIKGTNKKVKWTSKKKSVASVSKKGVVKAKKAGKTTIFAATGGKKYKCKVFVRKYFEIKIKTQFPKEFKNDLDQKVLVINYFRIKPQYNEYGNYDIYINYSATRLFNNPLYDKDPDIDYDEDYEENYYIVRFSIYDKNGIKVGTDVQREATGVIGTPGLLVGETRKVRNDPLSIGDGVYSTELKPGKYTFVFDFEIVF